MMKKIVVIPLGLIEDYINTGRTYQYLENYFNPNGFFDEVYCLSPGGENIKIGNVQYINAEPKDFGRIINKVKPDIVRAYAGFGPCDWAAANRVRNIPLVVSVHDTNPNLINQSLKYADYVVCMSQEVKKAVKSQVNIEEDRLYVMPNRVNTEVFYKIKNEEDFEKLNNKFGKGKHILHVGRKCEQKNLDTLIKAMQYLPQEYNAIFIGPGNTEPYEKLAQECKVAERCFFVDHVNKDDLPIIYSWCDCMCTPSRWEGFGIVFIEAAACECSIITSNIAPMNEYLTDGVDGILVDDYENPKAIADQIIKACDDKEYVQRMRTNARKVGLKFDKENIDKQEIALYENFICRGTDNTKLYELEKEREKMNKKVIIWGAGINGKKLLELCDKEKVEYFVDSDSKKVGQQIDGVKTISYADLLKIHKRYNVVVTPTDREKIVQTLTSNGIEYMEGNWYKILKEQNC